MKVVKLFKAKPLHQWGFFVNWYPRHWETNRMMMTLRDYGLFRDEHQDWKEEMTRQRALRGKVKKLRPVDQRPPPRNYPWPEPYKREKN